MPDTMVYGDAMLAAWSMELGWSMLHRTAVASAICTEHCTSQVRYVMNAVHRVVPSRPVYQAATMTFNWHCP